MIDPLSWLQRFVVGRYWSRWFATGGVRTWLHEPEVRRRVNRRVTGSEHVWPMDWFAERVVAGQRFSRGVSLGCGTGALERDVRRKGICQTMVGLDLSREALNQARQLAAEEQIDGIDYRQADFDRLSADDVAACDLAFFHQALHHVSALEPCLSRLSEALRPSGLLYLDEYVGPSRTNWSFESISLASKVFKALPDNVKRRKDLTLPIDRRDPSEAIRSAEILECVAEHFVIREQRDYGGNLLAVIHPHLDFDRVSESERVEILERLLDAEDEILASGVPSYYTVVVAEPRS